MNSLAERAEIRANFDLRRNYLALFLCLTKHKYSVNKALNRVYGSIIEGEGSRVPVGYWTAEDVQHMSELRAQGMTWRQIGTEMNALPQTLHAAWQRHMRGDEQDGTA